MLVDNHSPKRSSTWLNAGSVRWLVVCCLIWLGLGYLSSCIMDRQTSDAFGRNTAQVVTALLYQNVSSDDFAQGFGPELINELDSKFSPEFLNTYQIRSIELCDSAGKVLYATDKTNIGKYDTDGLAKISKSWLAAFEEDGLAIYSPVKFTDHTGNPGSVEISLASGAWDKLMWNMRLLNLAFIAASALLMLAAIYVLISRATVTIETKDEVMEDLDNRLAESNAHLSQTSSGTVSALLAALDAKDRYTARHASNVASYAVKIGVRMGISPADLELLQTAAILHDIGKIGIPEHILNKRGSLDDREFTLVKKHSELGSQIVEFVYLLKEAANIILFHHERFGGGGYPKGLSGDEIPLSSRILAVADVYDALTTDRPYRSAVPVEKAKQVLADGRGSQFDPAVVDAFLRMIDDDTAA